MFRIFNATKHAIQSKLSKQRLLKRNLWQPKVSFSIGSVFVTWIGASSYTSHKSTYGDNTDMKHVVLLGDSILDNGVYVRDKSGSVISQLKALVEPKGWHATLCAVDGNVISHIHRQLKTVPKDATHLVISIGGNNALGNLGVLSQPVTNVRDGLLRLNEVKLKFQEEYQHMLQTVLKHNLPVTLCTIYNPRFDNKNDQVAASIGLNVLNDVIIAEAAKAGLPIVDLRVIFTEYDDYANSIEPGVKGGAKIVKNINRILGEHDFSAKKSTIYCDV